MPKKKKTAPNHYFYCNIKKKYYDKPKLEISDRRTTVILTCPLCGMPFENWWIGD